MIKRVEEGKHNAIAKPCAVRARIISMPVRDKPVAMAVQARRNVPRRYILLPPTISEIDPNKRRVHPHERLLTAGGHRTAETGELALLLKRCLRSTSQYFRNRETSVLWKRARIGNEWMSNHLRRLSAKLMSLASVGKLTVIRPENVELRKVMQATVAT